MSREVKIYCKNLHIECKFEPRRKGEFPDSWYSSFLHEPPSGTSFHWWQNIAHQGAHLDLSDPQIFIAYKSPGGLWDSVLQVDSHVTPVLMLVSQALSNESEQNWQSLCSQ